ncbi:hypothetical protein [Paenibacillus sp. NPDC057967]|uniref:hypothetical protein n=1 Tax=Paenibacillus sp. NPDC057967 TaxID=3346293 RepID=UPI0036DB6D53
MKTTPLYSTPAYHKLVEYAFRNCYDGFEKYNTGSNKLVRDILNKGHLSITSHGSIVLTVEGYNPMEEGHILHSLATFKELNNYIRWTCECQTDFINSMNILTFLDIMYGLDSKSGKKGFHHFLTAKHCGLFKQLVDSIFEVPALRWFADHRYVIEGIKNPYLEYKPDLLKPAILSSDYIALKKLGLTDYELDVHSTITVEIVSDRAMSLLDARHTDMASRSEISQRYVSMSGDFHYRTPEGLSDIDVFYSEAGGPIKVTEYAKGQGLYHTFHPS